MPSLGRRRRLRPARRPVPPTSAREPGPASRRSRSAAPQPPRSTAPTRPTSRRTRCSPAARGSTRTSARSTPRSRSPGSPGSAGSARHAVARLVDRYTDGPLARLPRRAARQRAAAQPGARPARRARQTRHVGNRGKLRVYLGAAPGVGKTYAMLGEGHRRLERGTDVVVGFVETHGRRHTAEMVEGLEVVPRRALTYRGDHLHGDGPRRRPGAPPQGRAGRRARPHATCPGSRNAKRWQDVEELLAPASTSSPRSTSSTSSRSTTSSRRSPASRSRRPCPTRWSGPPTRSSCADMTAEALRRRLAHGNVYAPEKVDAALCRTTSGPATSTRCASSPCSGPPTGSTTRCRQYREQHDITGTWEARERVVVAPHRRTRGRDPDPPGGADRRAVQRRRPARRPRRPLRRARPEPARRRSPTNACSWSRSAAPTTRCSATTCPRRCWPSPGPRTPPSWCSATAVVQRSPAPRARARLRPRSRASGDIDVHIVTHGERGRGPACPRSEAASAAAGGCVGSRCRRCCPRS